MLWRRRGTPSSHIPRGSTAVENLSEVVSKGLMVQAIAVAAKLGITDLIAEGTRSADELAHATRAHAPSLYRLLRALTGLDVLVEDDAGRFSLGPLGDALRTGPASLRERAALFGDASLWDAWGRLEHSVRTGEPAFRYAHGVSFFEYLDQHAETHATFQTWMTRQTQLQIPSILEAYDFSSFRRVVDVGGGHGQLLAAIMRANPLLQGVLYDLPDVVENATYLRDPDLASRCEIVGGSFFEGVPPGGDCYFLKLVIHDWDDERALAVVRNVRKAMADHGRLLLFEFVMPRTNEFHHAKFMDLNMLVLTEGGRERTANEFSALYRAGGFSLSRVVPTASPLSILEGTPV